MPRHLWLAATALILSAPAVHAQDSMFLQNEAMNQLHSAMRENMIVAPTGEHATGERSVPSKVIARSAAGAKDASFRPSPVIRKRVQQRLIANVRRTSVEASAALAADMEQRDYMALLARAVTPLGLRTDNVHDAVALYWMGMWGTVSAPDRETPRLTRQQAQSVRAQVARSLDIAGAGLSGAAARQEFAEMLLHQTMLMDMAVDQADQAGNRADKARLAKAAGDALRSAGLPSERFRLTNAGFQAGTPQR